MANSNQLDAMKRYLKGNVEAIEFCGLFFKITQIWDDLYDRDKEVSPEAVSEAFIAALIDIPQNRFYVDNFIHLQPLIRAGINAWQDANDLQTMAAKDHLILAYVLRDLVGEVAIACAEIIGGREWARNVSLKMRLELINDEPFELFEKEWTK